MSEIKLLPCPFCGGVACQVFSVWGESYRYGCLTTGCMGNAHNQLHAFKTDKEAIEAWNTRKPMERIVDIMNVRKEFYEKRMKELSGKERDIEDWGSIKAYRDCLDIVRNGGKE